VSTSQTRTGTGNVELSGDDGPFLQVEDLTVSFPTEDGPLTAVRDLSYSVEKGKKLAAEAA
jgi:peptide/nickel transport system ATP-binding protein